LTLSTDTTIQWQSAPIWRPKRWAFIGIDGLSDPAGGLQKVKEGVLAATFVYPLCVEKAVEIGDRILRDKAFRPEKSYHVDSVMITPENVDSILNATASQSKSDRT
jgi:hypothetical protein